VDSDSISFRGSKSITFSVGNSSITIGESGIVIHGAPKLHLNPKGGGSGSSSVKKPRPPKRTGKSPKKTRIGKR
jgi:hypothetical protein